MKTDRDEEKKNENEKEKANESRKKEILLRSFCHCIHACLILRKNNK